MDAPTLAFEVPLPDEPLTVDRTQLQRLPDQRARRGVRSPLPMLLMVAILAKLADYHQVRVMAEWGLYAPAISLRCSSFPARPCPIRPDHPEPRVGHCRGSGCP